MGKLELELVKVREDLLRFSGGITFSRQPYFLGKYPALELTELLSTLKSLCPHSEGEDDSNPSVLTLFLRFNKRPKICFFNRGR